MINKMIEKYNNLSVQLKATFWFFACSVLLRGISTITIPIFTRLMSVAEFGQFNVFNSWLSIVQIIVTLQLSAGVHTMGIVKFKEEESVFTSSLQGLNLTLCIAWFLIYLGFRDICNKLLGLTTIQMIAMFVMIWSSTASVFWLATQRNRYEYKKMIAFTIIVSVLKPVIGIIMVSNAQDKVTARILGLSFVELICCSVFFFIQMYKGKKFYSAKFWKYALLFNLPLIPHYLSGVVLATSDRIMIEKLVGSSEAGIYSLAYSVSSVMSMVNDSLNKTMCPLIYQKIREKEYARIPKVVYSSLVIVGVANLFLIAIAPEIIAVFAPVEYRDAIYVIPPVAMSVFMNYLYLCFAPFEFYYEKRMWTTISTVTGGVLNLLLNYIFIPIFGYQAAGYTTLFCAAMTNIVHWFFVKKVCRECMDGVKIYSGKILLLISCLFIGTGFIYIPMYRNGVVRYCVTAVIIIMIIIKRVAIISAIKEGISRK